MRLQDLRLAGFGEVVEVDPDLMEWDYGRFEGKLTREVLKERPDWEMFCDGCPDGESPQDVAARADRFICVFAASRVTSWRFPAPTLSG